MRLDSRLFFYLFFSSFRHCCTTLIVCFSDLEQALQVLFREWREEVKESEKIQGDTITDLDKVSKELLQYEATLQQRIAETKENVRKLLKSS